MERKMTIEKLRRQIEKTIEALEVKANSSSEAIIDQYLMLYRDALKNFPDSTTEEIDISFFRSLKNCVRGYMETSSVWEQDFLREMGVTEKILKSL